MWWVDDWVKLHSLFHDRIELFWWHRGDLHNIREVVLILWVIGVYAQSFKEDTEDMVYKKYKFISLFTMSRKQPVIHSLFKKFFAKTIFYKLMLGRNGRHM